MHSRPIELAGCWEPRTTQPTSYNYSVLDDLLTVSQGLQTRTFVYDSLKRLTSSTNPESGTVGNTYDNNGNVLTRTDARSITTTITYDALNRPTLKNYSDATPDVAYFYDAQTLPGGAPSFSRGYSTGRLVAQTYGGASAGDYFGYDALGRTLRKIQQTDGVNYLIEAAYNVSSAMTSETYPSVPGAGDRRVITYSFDTAGRLSSLNSNATSYAPAASVTSISYAPHGGLASETHGGLFHAATYNNRLQTSQIKLGTSGNPTSVLSLTYNYGTTNNNGNIQSMTYAGGGLGYTQTFTYDSLNRLATAQEGASWSQTNGYDRYGNRWVVGSGLTFNTSNNRMVGYSYDASGNLLNDGVSAYTYDAEGHIKTVGGASAYIYNGDGQRVKKLVGENVRFVYGIGSELVAEFDGANGSLKKEYVYGGGTVATIEPTAVNSNGTRYSTVDHLGSPRVISNASAGVVSRHDYKPFGEELGTGIGGRTTGMGFGIADGNRKKFTGYERDNDTGLDFAQARYHSSTFGRFTSPDPFGGSMRPTNPQSFNRYSYTGNNPITRTDPSGLDWTSDARYHGQWSIGHQTMADVDRARAAGGPSGRDFEGSIEPQYPQPQAEQQPQEEVSVCVIEDSFEDVVISESGELTGIVLEAPEEPQIVFDSVELLDDSRAGFPQGPLNVARPVNPIRSATTNPLHPNQFILDVDHPEVDTNGILAIRVKFHVIAGTREALTVTTTERESRRWRIAGGPMNTEGGIIFHANVYDAEAKINPINVTVRTRWKASIWDRGKLNDIRYKSAAAEIILRIGPKDK